MLTEWLNRIENRFGNDLPGHSVNRMAPINRPVQSFRQEQFPDAHLASVLVLLYPVMGRPYLVLMERPDYDGVHSGQVSFPGGRSEKSDPSHWATALREAEEELGIDGTKVRHILSLSPLYIPPSNFFVRPYVGYTPQRPAFVPDGKEVKAIIECPVSLLTEPGTKGTMKINRGGLHTEVPCYKLYGRQVWGATAIILSELEVMVDSLPFSETSS
jgi:8-oxo-dGTP pyrophosphatase MutT (NUDIX family)